jgi:phosphopantothenoylcysteine decarboxylase / phosphopantothenate---cysteine ligase
MPLAGRNVVLCVTGSIAAYKAADLASKLVQAGAKVDVILTLEACEFITPLTFRSITGRSVYTDMFRPETDVPEEHVSLARLADIVVIAPATATTMARIAHGLADDFVSLTVLATRAPLLVAPAMDPQMWEAVVTQSNIALLRERGATFVGPEAGRLASGHMGFGRLAEPETIVGAVQLLLARNGELAGSKVIVTAGGTREPIDPVRLITNRSSGKMGFALAEAARDRGAQVTLISATDALPAPYGAELVMAETVSDMRNAVLEASKSADVLIMAAAVSDFRPAHPGEQKIKKNESRGLTLELVQNASFLREVPDSLVKVAFAAETQDLLANAMRKPESHGHLDLICANDVSQPDAGFGVDTNRVTILDYKGGIEELPLMTKYEVAQRILDRVAPLIHHKNH